MTSTMQAESHMSRWKTMLKRAAIGGEQEQSFERAFSSLAYVYAKDKAPKLFDYVLGFQLVDRDDDDTKAMGVFGFQIGDQMLYAPIFYLNGDLKGHELLYLKNSDIFVPLKESWVNAIIADKPQELGRTGTRNVGESGGMYPDMRRISIPPFSMKFAREAMMFASTKTATAESGWAPWMKGFLPVIASVRVSPLTKFAKAQEKSRLSLDRVLEESPELSVKMAATLMAYPGLRAGFERFYKWAILETALQKARRKLQSLRLGTEDRPATLLRKSVEDEPEEEKRASARLGLSGKPEDNIDRAQRKAVDYLTFAHLKIAADILSDSEKSDLMENGILIKDRRPDESITKVFDTTIGSSLTNPTETGMYELLVDPGKFEKCLIINRAVGHKGPEPLVIAIRMSDKVAVVSPSNKLFVKPSTEPREEFMKWLSEQPKASEMSVSRGGDGPGDDSPSDFSRSDCVLLTADGLGTMPIMVSDNLGDGNFQVSFRTFGTSTYEAPTMWRPWTPSQRLRYENILCGDDTPFFGDDGPPCSNQVLRVGGSRGKHFVAAGNAFYAPADTRAIKISGNYDKDPFLPIGPTQLRLERPPENVKVAAERGYNGSITISAMDLAKQYTSEHDALPALVMSFGMREKAARWILDELKTKPRVEVLCCFRSPYQVKDAMIAMGPSAPAIPPPMMTGGGMGGLSQPLVQSPMELHLPYQDVGAHNTDVSLYQPLRDFDPLQAQQGADSGQKEVFDTGMMAGLLKNTRDQQMVDRYLGDLTKAVDRLGRIYMSFLYHNDSFRERYGQTELPELEDGLRNSFESLGDVTLFLRERSVMPFLSQLGSADVGDAAQE